MNKPASPSPVWSSGWTLWLAAIVAVAGGIGATVWLYLDNGKANDPAPAVSNFKLGDIPFDGAQAYQYLKDLCAIGPRRSGSAGMKAQQKLLIDHFRKLGGQVELQQFRVRDPQNGNPVPMTNIIVHWNPHAAERILLGAHYDTLPFPVRDPQNTHGTFVGANDNASGVAILMQLAHDMPKLKTELGVDFLLLDGEEYVFGEEDPFFLGSEYFARTYAKSVAEQRIAHRYRWGVLLDMVGDADLQILQDRSSLAWKDTRPMVTQIWATAARLGVREFVARPMRDYDFRDDHIMLHDAGHIPCTDLIDFDYAPWHTQADTPDKCSALSLAKVGWVLEEWLKTAK